MQNILFDIIDRFSPPEKCPTLHPEERLWPRSKHEGEQTFLKPISKTMNKWHFPDNFLPKGEPFCRLPETRQERSTGGDGEVPHLHSPQTVLTQSSHSPHTSSHAWPSSLCRAAHLHWLCPTCRHAERNPGAPIFENNNENYWIESLMVFILLRLKKELTFLH